MIWVNKPRRIIIRDLIRSSLLGNPKKLEDIHAQIHPLKKSVPLYELQKQAEFLEKRGKITHCPLTQIYMGTNSAYSLHCE
jgi:hypothetical protein